MRWALLHGFAGTRSAWDDVLASSEQTHRPIRIALPGHGSEPVHATWDENVTAIARSHSLGRVEVVVGYSLGARIALALVAAGHVPRGVLISVNPGIPDDERAARRESDARWARLLREHGVAAFDAAWTQQPLFASQARVPAEQLAQRRAARLTLDAEQLARSLEVMGLAEMPDYRATFAAYGARIALIVGAEDAQYVAINRALPACSFEALAHCGHDPTLEQPRELAAAIDRAIARLCS